VKVFVTGATGFIGNHLSKRLVAENHQVICAGRSLSKLKDISGRAKLLTLDIKDPVAIKKILLIEKPDIVFHCAALVDNASLDKLMLINAEGTRNVMEGCLDNNIRKVIYLSSISVISANSQKPLTDDLPYGATNRYGKSKIEAEKIALSYREKGLKVSIIRPCMVYGEGEPHLLSLLARLIRWRLLPIVGTGDNKLHLVGVDNVVDVMMLALKKEEAFEGTYIVADKEVLSVREFFSDIAKMQGVKPPFTIPEKFIPILEKTPFLGKKILFFKKDRIYSIERIEKVLGYTPRVSVYDGLKKAVISCMVEKI